MLHACNRNRKNGLLSIKQVADRLENQKRLYREERKKIERAEKKWAGSLNKKKAYRHTI